MPFKDKSNENARTIGEMEMKRKPNPRTSYNLCFCDVLVCWCVGRMCDSKGNDSDAVYNVDMHPINICRRLE